MNFHRLTPLPCLVLLLLGLVSIPLRAADFESDFEAANQLYAQNQFPAAAAAYEKILAAGVQSPVLYFNLGNAYFKAGQIGHAIAAYRAAEQLRPRDPDLRANLRFAQNRVAGPTLRPAAWENALRQLSLREWTWLAAFGLWLTFGLLIVRQWKPALGPSLRTATFAAAVLTCLAATLLALSWTQHQPGRRAIITVAEASIRTSPFEEAPSAFTANDGAELHVLDQKDNWLQVTDAANRIGWVKRGAVHWQATW